MKLHFSLVYKSEIQKSENLKPFAEQKKKNKMRNLREQNNSFSKIHVFFSRESISYVLRSLFSINLFHIKIRLLNFKNITTNIGS